MSTKFARISIIGKPNAGKSTLLNRFTNQKISIVSPKEQTTRCAITGIVNVKETQIVFIDTPGIFTPKRGLDRAMVRCAWSNVSGADFIILLCDPSKDLQDEIEIARKIKGDNLLIVINKSDIIDDTFKLPEEFKNAFFISALKNRGCLDLLNYLEKKSKPGNWEYSEDDITTASSRFLASEITREQIFLKTYHEIPYSVMVENESFIELNSTAKIHQKILVKKDSHKSIIIGKKGALLKNIGQSARKEIASVLGYETVHLFLHVSIKSDWDEKHQNLQYYNLA